MRVALVSLLPRDERANCLGLAYLKAYAESRPELTGKVSISLLDAPVEEVAEDLAGQVMDLSPDLVGFHCQLCNEEKVTAVARRLRSYRPKLRMVLGGQEASLHPERLLRESEGEFAVLDEGEETFAELLGALVSDAPLDGVRGLMFRKGDGFKRTPARAPVADLSRLPSPYLSVPLPEAWASIGRAAIETTRGCPFGCAFCSWPNNVKPRHFPLERVREELRVILSMDPAVLVHFADPDIFQYRDRAKEILRFIREEDPDERARYWFNAYFGNFDEELASLCDHPGFILEGGVQSTNPEALGAAARRFDEEAVSRGVRLIKDKAPRAKTTLQIILGLPGDTLDGFLASLEWIHGQGVGEAQVFPMQLFPETEFHTRAGEWGIEANPEPPYEVRGTASFPAADMREARLAVLRLDLVRRHPGAWQAVLEAGAPARAGAPAGAGGPLWRRAAEVVDFAEREFKLPLAEEMERCERRCCRYLTPIASGPDPFEARAFEEAAREWLKRRAGAASK